jgi:acetamidase/formamidase
VIKLEGSENQPIQRLSAAKERLYLKVLSFCFTNFNRMKKQHFTWIFLFALTFVSFSCEQSVSSSETEQRVVSETATAEKQIPEPQFTLTKDQTHNRFSRTIPPVLTVPSGAVIEAFTEEASDEQFTPDSDVTALETLSFDPIHPVTGPVYVEGAEPGDVLKVTLHKIELMDWGWTAIVPGFGFLADDFTEPYLKTFQLSNDQKTVAFNDKINIPLRPFPGVMAVAPDTDEMLNTIPPRANGGNMDDPNIVEGTTVYFPVFVEGGLFSIGDTHAAQGMGEVCGTAIEAPMRIVYEIEV